MVLLAAGLLVAAAASTFTGLPEQEVVDAGAGASAQSGADVALSGSFGVLNRVLSNVVAVFEFDGTWVEHSLLSASAGSAASDNFGTRVDLKNDLLLAGARFEDDTLTNQGAVHVFEYASGTDTWSEIQVLTADNPLAEDRFGRALALDGVGDFLMVAADIDAGRVEVFERNGPTFEYHSQLGGTVGGSGDAFGTGMDMDGTYAAVAAPHEDYGASDSGALYMYHFDGSSWTLQTKLSADLPENGLLLGEDVSLSDNVVFAGAIGADGFFGAAFVYERTGSVWAQETKLTAESSLAEFFGISVAVDMSVSRGVVGASSSDSGLGAVFVYERTTSWALAMKLTVSSPAIGDVFGGSVAISGAVVLAGANGRNLSGANSGAGVFFGVPMAGAVGDPMVVDFFGHRFLAGHRPDQWLLLFKGAERQVLLRTSSAQGREAGYFVDALLFSTDGCGAVRVVAQPGAAPRSEATATTACAESLVARGDRGVVALPILDGVLFVAPHVTGAGGEVGFLNIKVQGVSQQAARVPCQGMLCDERHQDLVLGGDF